MSKPLYFVLDGVSSANVGLRQLQPIRYSSPKPVFEQVDVPGRNGPLFFCTGSYEPVNGTTECCIPRRNGVSDAFTAVNAFLLGTLGYRRLEDPLEPDYFRQAFVSVGAEYYRQAPNYAPFTLELICKPQKFLKTGEDTVTLADSGSALYNPTVFDALPLITVYGSGESTLTVGAYTSTTSTVSWTSGDTEVTIAPCDEDGTVYEADDYGTSLPSDASEGDCFLLTETSVQSYGYDDGTLYRYSGSSWSAVSLVYCLVSATGIGADFEVGDKISFAGADCTSYSFYSVPDGDYTILKKDDDWIMLNVEPFGDNYFGSLILTGTKAQWFSIDGSASRTRTWSSGEVSVSAERTVISGGTTVTFNTLDEFCTLDCENDNAYKDDLNCNNSIEAADFPVLSAGKNLFSWTGGITKIEVIPRWWTL